MTQPVKSNINLKGLHVSGNCQISKLSFDSLALKSFLVLGLNALDYSAVRPRIKLNSVPDFHALRIAVVDVSINNKRMKKTMLQFRKQYTVGTRSKTRHSNQMHTVNKSHEGYLFSETNDCPVVCKNYVKPLGVLTFGHR